MAAPGDGAAGGEGGEVEGFGGTLGDRAASGVSVWGEEREEMQGGEDLPAGGVAGVVGALDAASFEGGAVDGSGGGEMR